MTWWYLAIPTAAFAGYLVYLEIVNRRRAESLRADFNARDRLDPGTWFAAFAGSGLSHERLVEVLSPVARAIGCEVTQLRPTDSFDGTLRWRGIAFLGIVDDDNPWNDFLKCDLPRLCGNEERTWTVIDHLQTTPTLQRLVEAIRSLDEPGVPVGAE